MTTGNKTCYCTFCGHSENEVRAMVGLDVYGAFICDWCVGHSIRIMIASGKLTLAEIVGAGKLVAHPGNPVAAAPAPPPLSPIVPAPPPAVDAG